MADHLTKLAWRALGLLPVAQPRIPSRFAETPDDLFELPAEGWNPAPAEPIPILAPATPPPLPPQREGQAGRRPAAPAHPAPPRRAAAPAEPAPDGEPDPADLAAPVEDTGEADGEREARASSAAAVERGLPVGSLTPGPSPISLPPFRERGDQQEAGVAPEGTVFNIPKVGEGLAPSRVGGEAVQPEGLPQPGPAALTPGPSPIPLPPFRERGDQVEAGVAPEGTVSNISKVGEGLAPSRVGGEVVQSEGLPQPGPSASAPAAAALTPGPSPIPLPPIRERGEQQEGVSPEGTVSNNSKVGEGLAPSRVGGEVVQSASLPQRGPAESGPSASALTPGPSPIPLPPFRERGDQIEPAGETLDRLVSRAESEEPLGALDREVTGPSSAPLSPRSPVGSAAEPRVGASQRADASAPIPGSPSAASPPLVQRSPKSEAAPVAPWAESFAERSPLEAAPEGQEPLAQGFNPGSGDAGGTVPPSSAAPSTVQRTPILGADSGSPVPNASESRSALTPGPSPIPFPPIRERGDQIGPTGETLDRLVSRAESEEPLGALDRDVTGPSSAPLSPRSPVGSAAEPRVGASQRADASAPIAGSPSAASPPPVQRSLKSEAAPVAPWAESFAERSPLEAAPEGQEPLAQGFNPGSGDAGGTVPPSSAAPSTVQRTPILGADSGSPVPNASESRSALTPGPSPIPFPPVRERGGQQEAGVAPGSTVSNISKVGEGLAPSRVGGEVVQSASLPQPGPAESGPSASTLTPGPSPIPLPPFRERGDQIGLTGETLDRLVSSAESAEPLRTLDRDVTRPSSAPVSSPRLPAGSASEPAAGASQQAGASAPIPGSPANASAPPVQRSPESGAAPVVPGSESFTDSSPIGAAPEGQESPAQGFNPGSGDAGGTVSPSTAAPSPVQRTPIPGADSGSPVPNASEPRSALTPGPSPIPLPAFRERGDQIGPTGETLDRLVSSAESEEPLGALDRDVTGSSSAPLSPRSPVGAAAEPRVGASQRADASATITGSPTAASPPLVQRSPESGAAPVVPRAESFTSSSPIGAAPEGQEPLAQGFNPGSGDAAGTTPLSPVQRTPSPGADSGSPVPNASEPRSALTPGPSPIPLPAFRERGDQIGPTGETLDRLVSSAESAEPLRTLDRDVTRPSSAPVSSPRLPVGSASEPAAGASQQAGASAPIAGSPSAASPTPVQRSPESGAAPVVPRAESFTGSSPLEAAPEGQEPLAQGFNPGSGDAAGITPPSPVQRTPSPGADSGSPVPNASEPRSALTPAPSPIPLPPIRERGDQIGPTGETLDRLVSSAESAEPLGTLDGEMTRPSSAPVAPRSPLGSAAEPRARASQQADVSAPITGSPSAASAPPIQRSFEPGAAPFAPRVGGLVEPSPLGAAPEGQGHVAQGFNPGSGDAGGTVPPSTAAASTVQRTPIPGADSGSPVPNASEPRSDLTPGPSPIPLPPFRERGDQIGPTGETLDRLVSSAESEEPLGALDRDVTGPSSAPLSPRPPVGSAAEPRVGASQRADASATITGSPTAASPPLVQRSPESGAALVVPRAESFTSSSPIGAAPEGQEPLAQGFNPGSGDAAGTTPPSPVQRTPSPGADSGSPVPNASEPRSALTPGPSPIPLPAFRERGDQIGPTGEALDRLVSSAESAEPLRTLDRDVTRPSSAPVSSPRLPVGSASEPAAGASQQAGASAPIAGSPSAASPPPVQRSPKSEAAPVAPWAESFAERSPLEAAPEGQEPLAQGFNPGSGDAAGTTPPSPVQRTPSPGADSDSPTPSASEPRSTLTPGPSPNPLPPFRERGDQIGPTGETLDRLVSSAESAEPLRTLDRDVTRPSSAPVAPRLPEGSAAELGTGARQQADASAPVIGSPSAASAPLVQRSPESGAAPVVPRAESFTDSSPIGAAPEGQEPLAQGFNPGSGDAAGTLPPSPVQRTPIPGAESGVPAPIASEPRADEPLPPGPSPIPLPPFRERGDQIGPTGETLDRLVSSADSAESLRTLDRDVTRPSSAPVAPRLPVGSAAEPSSPSAASSPPVQRSPSTAPPSLVQRTPIPGADSDAPVPNASEPRSALTPGPSPIPLPPIRERGDQMWSAGETTLDRLVSSAEAAEPLGTLDREVTRPSSTPVAPRSEEGSPAEPRAGVPQQADASSPITSSPSAASATPVQRSFESGAAPVAPRAESFTDSSPIGVAPEGQERPAQGFNPGNGEPADTGETAGTASPPSSVQRTPILGADSAAPTPSAPQTRAGEALTPSPSPIPLPPFRERGDQIQSAGETLDRLVGSAELAEPLKTLDREVTRPSSAPVAPRSQVGSAAVPRVGASQPADASAPITGSTSVAPAAPVQRSFEPGAAPVALRAESFTDSSPIGAAPEGQERLAQGFNPGSGDAAGAVPPSPAALSPVERTSIPGADSGSPSPIASEPRSALTPSPSPIPLPPFRERGDQVQPAGETLDRLMSSTESAEPLGTLDRDVTRPSSAPVSPRLPGRAASEPRAGAPQQADASAPVTGSLSAPSTPPVQRAPKSVASPVAPWTESLAEPLPLEAAPEGQGHVAQGFNPGNLGTAEAVSPSPSLVQLDRLVSSAEPAEPLRTMDRAVRRPSSPPAFSRLPARSAAQRSGAPVRANGPAPAVDSSAEAQLAPRVAGVEPSPSAAVPAVQAQRQESVVQRAPVAGADVAPPARAAGGPLAGFGESAAAPLVSRPFVADSPAAPEMARPRAEARQSVETPEGRRVPETPAAALARILASNALADVARPDLLAIAERNLFGPLPGEPTRQPVQVATRPVAQEQSPGKPAFRVSIGRLEVVAAPPVESPAPPVRQRPEPKTNLQSYLDRRRQGRS